MAPLRDTEDLAQETSPVPSASAAVTGRHAPEAGLSLPVPPPQLPIPWPHAAGRSPARLRHRRVRPEPAPPSGERQRTEPGQRAWQGPWETRTGLDVGQRGGGTSAGQPVTRRLRPAPVSSAGRQAATLPGRPSCPPAHMGHSRSRASARPSPLTQTNTPGEQCRTEGYPPPASLSPSRQHPAPCPNTSAQHHRRA